LTLDQRYIVAEIRADQLSVNAIRITAALVFAVIGILTLAGLSG
jgi:hypothetical protein